MEIHSADAGEHSHGDSNDSRSDELYINRPTPLPPQGGVVTFERGGGIWLEYYL